MLDTFPKFGHRQQFNVLLPAYHLRMISRWCLNVVQFFSAVVGFHPPFSAAIQKKIYKNALWKPDNLLLPLNSGAHHGVVVYMVLVAPVWRFTRLDKSSVHVQEGNMITLQQQRCCIMKLLIARLLIAHNEINKFYLTE